MEEVQIKTTLAKAEIYSDMMNAFNEKYERISSLKKGDIAHICNEIMKGTGNKWRVEWKPRKAFTLYRVSKPCVRRARREAVDEPVHDEPIMTYVSAQRRGRLLNRVMNRARREAVDEPVHDELIITYVSAQRRGRLLNRVMNGEHEPVRDEPVHDVDDNDDESFQASGFNVDDGDLTVHNVNVGTNASTITTTASDPVGSTRDMIKPTANVNTNVGTSTTAACDPVGGTGDIIEHTANVNTNADTSTTATCDLVGHTGDMVFTAVNVGTNAGASAAYNTRVSFAQRNVQKRYETRALIDRSCKYNSLGCTERSSSTRLAQHENKCPYSLCGCPCNNAVSNCSFGNGKISDLVQHLKTAHNAEVESTLDFTRTYPLSGSYVADNPTFMPTVIESIERLFYLHF